MQALLVVDRSVAATDIEIGGASATMGNQQTGDLCGSKTLAPFENTEKHMGLIGKNLVTRPSEDLVILLQLHEIWGLSKLTRSIRLNIPLCQGAIDVYMLMSYVQLGACCTTITCLAWLWLKGIARMTATG